VRDYRIRLFEEQVRYVPYRCTMRGGGSGNRFITGCIIRQYSVAR
jgi:hypothetical protein